MIGSNKEKEVCRMLEQHFRAVEECLAEAERTLKLFFDKKIDDANRAAGEVDRIEREADALQRQIYRLLSSGAFLPILRGDIHGLVDAIDDLADFAEDVSDVATGEHPDVPEQVQGRLLEILSLTLDQCAVIREATISFFSASRPDDGAIRAQIKKVAEVEHAVDQKERSLRRAIFSSELPLANKLQLGQFLNLIASISDHAEDVSDTLSELMVKMQT